MPVIEFSAQNKNVGEVEMVRNDPNTWTKDFVKNNKLFALIFLLKPIR